MRCCIGSQKAALHRFPSAPFGPISGPASEKAVRIRIEPELQLVAIVDRMNAKWTCRRRPRDRAQLHAHLLTDDADGGWEGWNDHSSSLSSRRRFHERRRHMASTNRLLRTNSAAAGHIRWQPRTHVWTHIHTCSPHIYIYIYNMYNFVYIIYINK